MAELLYLMVIAVVVAIVTVLGHGLWLLFAAIGRALSGGERSFAGARRCPACGHPDGVFGGRCRFCGARIDDQRDADATARVLWRLLESKAITQAQHDQILQALRQEPARRATPAPPVPSASTIQQTVEQPATDEGITYVTAPPETGTAASTGPAKPSVPSSEEEIVDAEIVQPLPIQPAPTRSSTPPTPPGAPPGAREDAPTAAPESRATSTSRRTVADLLQAFMLERNIRWGELLSGLLIVGSAIGLVISLRHTLSEAIPYFPALLFMLGTAAVHGAGLYTLRRWNLRATSRGVLIIGMLLVPLNFLAAIVLSGTEDDRFAVTDPRYIGAVAIGLISFGLMTYFASRALLARGYWWLVLAVMGTSAGQLIIDRFGRGGMSTIPTNALLALPLGCFLIGTIAYVRRVARWRKLSSARVDSLFLLLAIATFSLLAPLGLLVAKTATLRATLAQLSPSLSLASALILCAGLLVHRRVTAKSLAKLRTAGTALAIIGGVLMFAMVVLAWPRPDLLIAVGLVNFLILVGLALLADLSVLHAPALGCLTISYLTAAHLLLGTVHVELDSGSRLVNAFCSDETCVAFTLLAGAAASAGFFLCRAERRKDGRIYWWGSGVLSGLSVVLALAVGFFSPALHSAWATPVVIVNAAAWFVAAALLRSWALSWTGSGLLLLALVHALTFNEPLLAVLGRTSLVPDQPVLIAVLLHAGITVVISLATCWRMSRRQHDPKLVDTFVTPLNGLALLATLISTPVVLYVVDGAYAAHAGYAIWIAAVWLAIALMHRQPAVFGAFQTIATIAVAFSTCAFTLAFNLWDGSRGDLRIWPWHICVLAVWCLSWCVGRSFAQRMRQTDQWLETGWPQIEHVVLGAVIVAVTIFCTVGVWPGLWTELGAGAEFAGRDVNYHVASGPGAWCSLGFVLAALLVTMRAGGNTVWTAALMIVLAWVPILIASWWESSTATATALRWMFMFYGVVLAAAYCGRDRLANWIARSRVFGTRMLSPGRPHALRNFALVLSGAPIVFISLAAGVQKTLGVKLAGPAPESLFGQLGPVASYSIPGFVFVAVLLACSIRDRSSALVFAGSILLQTTTTIAVLLKPLLVTGTIDVPVLVRLLQWNALALVAYSWVWLALRRRLEPQSEARRARDVTLLGVQLASAVAVSCLLPVWATIAVIVFPDGAPDTLAPLGNFFTYVIVLAAAAAAFLAVRERFLGAVAHVVGGTLIGFTGLIALSVSLNFAAWSGVYTLLLGWTSLAALATVSNVAVRSANKAAIAMFAERTATIISIARSWATVVGGLVVFLALRSCLFAPSIWWCIWPVAVISVLAIAFGVQGRSQTYAYLSVPLAMLATSLYWIEVWRGPVDEVQSVVQLIEANLLVACVVGAFWLMMELRCQRRHAQSLDLSFDWSPVHHTAACSATVLLSTMILGGAMFNSALRAMDAAPWFDVSNLLTIPVVAAVGLLLVGSLWDRRGFFAVPCLYAWGLALLTATIDQLEDFGFVDPAGMLVLMGLVVSGYVALTGHLWKWGLNLARWGSRLGMPQTVAQLERTSRWLPKVSLTLTALVVAAEFAVVLSFEERWMRVCAGFAPLLLAYGIASLAQESRREAMQLLTLLLAALAAVFIGWADIPIALQAPVMLERFVRLLISVSVVTIVYGIIAAKLRSSEHEWLPALRRVTAACVCLSISALAIVLVLETAFFEPGVGAPVSHGYQVVTVAIVLVGLIVALLAMAVLPGRDPFALPQRRRMMYVYGAELVAALLAGHLYLVEPQLFATPLRAYWPYMVMLIAFAGTGAGELFQRKGLRVLAEPLQRTAAFLPLLPVLGFWVLSRDSELSVVAGGLPFSTLLVVVGLLYVVLGILRKSLVSSIAAALAGNAALLMFYAERDFLFLSHPQFWLIPPALSLMVAAQINRHRLDAGALAAVRYGCMLVIYVSSMAEMMIESAQGQLWPPMVLAGLAVLGALAGILMRIRAFLYLGCTFVFVATVTMVRNAAQAIQHVWPWWAFGMGLGICILFLFGVFEMKREQVTRLVKQLRKWDG